MTDSERYDRGEVTVNESQPGLEPAQKFINLTGAIGVDHEPLVDMVLDEQKSLLKDLSSTSLLHRVGVTWVPEKS